MGPHGRSAAAFSVRPAGVARGRARRDVAATGRLALAGGTDLVTLRAGGDRRARSARRHQVDPRAARRRRRDESNDRRRNDDARACWRPGVPDSTRSSTGRAWSAARRRALARRWAATSFAPRPRATRCAACWCSTPVCICARSTAIERCRSASSSRVPDATQARERAAHRGRGPAPRRRLELPALHVPQRDGPRRRRGRGQGQPRSQACARPRRSRSAPSGRCRCSCPMPPRRSSERLRAARDRSRVRRPGGGGHSDR